MKKKRSGRKEENLPASEEIVHLFLKHFGNL
jgi:hypothetical protein